MGVWACVRWPDVRVSLHSHTPTLAHAHTPGRLPSWVRHHPTVPVGIAVVLLLVVAALLAPALAPADPLKTMLSARLKPPLSRVGPSLYLLGTDELGRDILSRLLYGGRVSLSLSLIAVVLSGAIGVLLGLLAGYHGGWVDELIMRLADIQLSFPVIMLGVAVLAVVGTSLSALVGVLALSGWVIFARTVRALALTVKEIEFIAAARALGAGDLRILLRHLLPNIQASILVIATVQLATMILLESGLSFLGLGTQPPEPSWGGMLAQGRDYLDKAWWLATVPGLAIAVAVLGVNLLGDGLRDLLDPRLRSAAGS